MAEDKVQEAPEGEDSEGQEGEGVKPKKKLSMKMMLIAGAAALVVVGESKMGQAVQKAARNAEKRVAKDLNVSPKDIDNAVKEAAGEVS